MNAISTALPNHPEHGIYLSQADSYENEARDRRPIAWHTREGSFCRQSLAPYLISTPLSRGLSPIDRAGTSVGSEPLFRQMPGAEILGSTPWRSDSG
jgi:hypothetical protein